jgi:hypothetical protein
MYSDSGGNAVKRTDRDTGAAIDTGKGACALTQ